MKITQRANPIYQIYFNSQRQVINRSNLRIYLIVVNTTHNAYTNYICNFELILCRLINLSRKKP